MVIGCPLAQTQSPCLHDYIYQYLGLNAVLLAFSHSSILPLINAIKALHVGLTAVTLPFKQVVMKYLTSCDIVAQKVGAINTIIQHDERLYGYNTDINGIEYALKNIMLKDKNVLIMGAGGAARAAGYVMQEHGANIFWLNRTRKRAVKLSNDFSGTVINHQQLKNIPVDLIINTTPLGMYPNEKESPLPNYSFKPSHIVFDMVYHPMDTQLLLAAKKANAKTIPGIQMFIGQGIRQVELWTRKHINLNHAALSRLNKLLIQQQLSLKKV